MKKTAKPSVTSIQSYDAIADSRNLTERFGAAAVAFARARERECLWYSDSEGAAFWRGQAQTLATG